MGAVARDRDLSTQERGLSYIDLRTRVPVRRRSPFWTLRHDQLADVRDPPAQSRRSWCWARRWTRTTRRSTQKRRLTLSSVGNSAICLKFQLLRGSPNG